MTVISRHFVLCSSTELAFRCQLPQTQAFASLGKGRVSPTPMLSSMRLGVGAGSPVSLHRRLANVRGCASPPLDTPRLLPVPCQLGTVAFLPLENLPPKNMLPSASPLHCNCLLQSQTVRQGVLPQGNPNPLSRVQQIPAPSTCPAVRSAPELTGSQDAPGPLPR